MTAVTVPDFTLKLVQTSRSDSTMSYTGLYLFGTKDIYKADINIRVSIRADYYPKQSTAKIEMWTASGWTLLWHIDPGNIVAKLDNRNSASSYRSDIEYLLKAASLILK